MTRAVVFGYHNVGVRCLDVLHAGSVEVSLVLTHEDDPGETLWFGSVAERARRYRMPVIAPQDPNRNEVFQRVRAAAPDIIFSFYYRQLLGPQLLALPPLGAFNMHGSLLPHYRGRAPVNWAILHGERETGATQSTQVGVFQQLDNVVAEVLASKTLFKQVISAGFYIFGIGVAILWRIC